MPTATGAETIGERLSRLRTELVRVRETIGRMENNGASFSIGGTAITQVAYDRALRREREIQREVAQLEARLAGGRGASGMAQTVTRMHG